MSLTDPNILICYSNPEDTTRIRLDVEHREAEKAIRKGYLRQIHAARFSDLVEALSNTTFDVFQFSGHGSPEGILLESDGDGIVPPDRIRSLLRLCKPPPKILILTCCYSNTYAATLVSDVPYIFSVEGEAGDDASIEFSKSFYSLFRDGVTVETAFQFAKLQNEDLDVHLHSKEIILNDDIIVSSIASSLYTAMIDVSPVRGKLDGLGVKESDLFRAMSRGLTGHRTLFDEPQEKSLIPFGEYLGIFSWKNIIEPIVCDDIFRLCEGVSANEFRAVSRLFVTHSMLASARYRLQERKHYPGKGAQLKAALERHHSALKEIFDSENSKVFETYSGSAFKIASGVASANVEQADADWANDDLEQCVIHLEIALTAIHNLALNLCDNIRAEQDVDPNA